MKSAIRISENWDLNKYMGIKRYFGMMVGIIAKEIAQDLHVSGFFSAFMLPLQIQCFLGN